MSLEGCTICSPGCKICLQIPETPANPITLLDPSGQLIANTYQRVVIGQRGLYIELNREDFCCDLKIPETQKWRQTDNWKHKVYYYEYRTPGGVMVYHQMKRVNYADYQVRKFYISPWDVQGKDGRKCAAGPAHKMKLD